MTTSTTSTTSTAGVAKNPFQPDSRALDARRRGANVLAIAVTALFAILAGAFLLYLIVYVARLGLKYINVDFFTQRPKAEGESGGGWAPALQGTAVLVGLASLVGIPLGMATGVYLSEFGRGWLASVVRFLVDMLTGIPTIIFGLFAWVILVVPLHSSSALSGGVALSIIMIPTVARASEEVLRLVPRELREASVALGATESRTILRVVIPAARSGILTGIMLAIARVAGETAPLLMTAGGSTFFNTSLLRPIDSIPLRIFDFTLSPFPSEQNQAYAGALVIMLLVILTSLAVRWATGGFRPRGALMRDFKVVPGHETPGEHRLAIQVEHLNAWYDRTQALHDINLEIAPLSVTALIGPSGCGKSTFVRCLNRLHEEIYGARVEGKVLVDGVNIYAPGIIPMYVRRHIGMVFQQPNVLPTRSIFDNVAMGIRLNGLASGKELNDLVERSLHQAAIWDEVKDRLNTLASGLSGGQQQRLCIARALAVEPQILLMDEPASALDPLATLQIEELMTSLKRNYTIVVVTHNMQQAGRVADRTVFFLSGHIIEEGETSQIFSRPEKRETEDYVTGRFG